MIVDLTSGTPRERQPYVETRSTFGCQQDSNFDAINKDSNIIPPITKQSFMVSDEDNDDDSDRTLKQGEYDSEDYNVEDVDGDSQFDQIDGRDSVE